LLHRFVTGRDEHAFAVLLGRHGRLVWSVCRRLLGQDQDAEDVFQATFAALARKASTIRKGQAVGNWLYGAAVRTALDARKKKARRRRHDGLARGRAPDQPVTEAALRELEAILHEEVGRLPEKVRAPFVLCCLEGRSRIETARELGWNEGTLSSRLAQAREQLRARLSARGVTLTAALTTAALGTEATAAVPAGLTAVTLRNALAAQAAPAWGVAWVKGVLRLLSAAPWKWRAALVLLVGALAGVGAAFGPRRAAVEDGPARQAEQPVERPRTERQAATLDPYGDPLPPGAVGRLGALRWRHEGEAKSMAFSPDGKVLATTSRDGLVFYDTATGRALDRRKTAVESPDHAVAVAYSPDGKYFAFQVQDQDRAVHLWDAAARTPVRALVASRGRPARLDFMNICFSPDSKWLAASAGPDLVAVWDVATGRQIAAVKGHNHDNPGLAFSPDGKTLALAGREPGLRLWDMASGQFRRDLLAGQTAFSLGFSPDGKVIATGGTGRRGRIVLTDAATGEERGRLETDENALPVQLAFAPDGTTLLSATEDARVRVWDVARRQERFVLGKNPLIGQSMALSADGKTVALGTAYNVIRLWSVVTGKGFVPPADGHTGAVRAVAFSPGGGLLATGAETPGILLWDPAGKRAPQRVPGTGAWTLSFSPDGRRLATAFGREVVGLWDVARAEGRPLFSAEGTGDVPCAAFTPDGKTVVCLHEKAADGGDAPGTASLRGWDAAAGKLLWAVNLPGLSAPRCLALSPGGKLAAVAGRAATPVRFIDLARRRERPAPRSPKGSVVSLAFAPDGGVLAAGRIDHTVRLLEVATGEEILALRGHTRSVAAVAFTPDGRVLASADGGPVSKFWDASRSAPQQIRLWDVATGRQLAAFAGHASDVASLAFSPDGKRLVSGLANGSVMIWDMSDKVPPPPIAQRLGTRELEVCWADLAAADARRAYVAVHVLASAADQAVSYLKSRLHPAQPVDAALVNRLLADMDHAQFARRRAATEALSRLGAQVEPALRQQLTRVSSEETRRRLLLLLDKTDWASSPELVRQGRAVRVLERAGTSEAQVVLEHLARGTPDAWLTQAAREAVERLARRKATLNRTTPDAR
jgi:RNA polymerase sigma factor (sigma-70 family)